MKNTLAGAFAISIAMALSPVAASAVTLTASLPQTSDSQNFAFGFSADLSDGTAGTLTIHARGDYGRLASEVLSFDIDGIASGGPFGAFPDVLGAGPNYGGVGGPFESVILHSLSPDDYEFTKKVTISGADMLAITADSALTINLTTGLGVSNLNDLSFVSVKLEYAAVPLPATLLPLLTALGGFVLMGRRRRQRAQHA